MKSGHENSSNSPKKSGSISAASAKNKAAVVSLQHGNRRASIRINKSVSIGRASSNEIVIAENDVMLIHARISTEKQGYSLADFSDGKTLLNGASFRGKQPLQNNDRIQIGSALLLFQAAHKPERTKSLSQNPKDDLQRPSHIEKPNGSGTGSKKTADKRKPDRSAIFTFPCSCGAKLKARSSMSGRHGKCKHCGIRILIPSPKEPSTKRKTEQSSKKENATIPNKRQKETISNQPKHVQEEKELGTCAICQCLIDTGEETTLCSSCGLPFHTECWKENLGCAAYGCSNVDVLKTSPDIRIPIQTSPPPVPTASHPPEKKQMNRSEFLGIPWHWIRWWVIMGLLKGLLIWSQGNKKKREERERKAWEREAWEREERERKAREREAWEREERERKAREHREQSNDHASQFWSPKNINPTKPKK